MAGARISFGASKEGADMLASKDFLEELIQSCPDGIIAVNREGIIVVFNEAAEKLTGFNSAEVLGKLSIADIYRSPDLARHVKKMLYAQENGGKGRLEGLEVEVKGAANRSIPIRLSATLLFDDDKEVGSVGFFHDMSARKQMEDELRRRSITDSLTGLYNRRHFHIVLTEEVARGHRYGRALTVALFDLDNFKPFNDTYGHQEGDNILRFVSNAMRASLRQQDQAFRLGGDEFAFILVETDLEHGRLAVERFRQSFNDSWPAKMSFLGGHLIPVTVSTGVAQLDEGEKTDKLFMRADLAMYEAKKDGGNRTITARSEIKTD